MKIIVTETAQRGLTEILNKKGGSKFLGLRLQVHGGVPGAWQSDFRPVRPGDEQPGDLVLDQGAFKIFVDPASSEKLEGIVIDMVPTFSGPRFRIDYPQPVWETPLETQLQELITNQINPGLASHGGYTALLGVERGKARIMMGGGCQGCGLSQATLRQGIEVMIRQAIPEITEIIDETDHEAGDNPYYQSIPDPSLGASSPLVDG
jgi:Fe/S biogenesis protein NfuA